MITESDRRRMPLDRVTVDTRVAFIDAIEVQERRNSHLWNALKMSRAECARLRRRIAELEEARA